MSKPKTKAEILKLVDARLLRLRNGHEAPSTKMHQQERDLAFRRQGEIDALEDVRLLLTGERGTFIV